MALDFNPKIGIIIVNYNGAKDTIECIDSLMTINYKEIEIIVVDNKSTDNSEAILQAYNKDGKFKLIPADRNGGFSYGNNVGIREAIKDGVDYVLLLNNDTLVEAEFLNTLVSFLSKHRKAVLTGTILYAFNRNKIWYAGGHVSKWTCRTSHENQDKTIDSITNRDKRVSFISGCEMLIPVSVIKHVGYLDEDYFLYSEDTDYCLRLIKNNIDMFYVPSSVIYHKVSASTSKISSLTNYYSARNRRILIKKNLKFPQSLTAVIFTYLQIFRRILDGRQSLGPVALGIQDYRRNKWGKCDRSL